MKIKLMSNYDKMKNLLKIIRDYEKLHPEQKATKHIPQLNIDKNLPKDSFIKSKDIANEKSTHN